MVEFIEFSPGKVKELYKGHKILIVADFSKVSYENEDKDIHSRLADKYKVDLYPVCTGITSRVFTTLCRYYRDYDYWLIDESLLYKKEKGSQKSEAY